jgi:inorganic pyrophosphatase
MRYPKKLKSVKKTPPKSSKMAKAAPVRPTPISHSRPHPWHGLEEGPNPPEVLNVFVEITPYDLVKYEIDKISGYLKVDRPHRTSSQPPALYGFVPRTYCGPRVHRLSPNSIKGDGDPLDICVLSEREITRGEVIVHARVVGGLQMIDGQEADDKIIGVLEQDLIWGGARDITDLPSVLIERLEHYFLTYKLVPGQAPKAHIDKVYGRKHALRVVEASLADYIEKFR